MDVPVQSRQLVAIEYPGTVVNVENMIRNFGGEKRLNTDLLDPTKRIELRFRPNDPYSKPTYGDSFTCTSLVVEVVRRKKKNCDDPASVTYNVKCIGTLNNIYKFKSICDFQLLPVCRNENGNAESLIPKIVPKDLYPSTWLEEENVPLFIIPTIFSRFHTAQDVYREGRQIVHRKPVKVVESNLISTSRRPRPGYSLFCSFDSADIYYEPLPEALKELQQYQQLVTLKQKLDELFEERPIWTKNALLTICNISQRQRIKLPLTCTAYYFNNGPWRTLWVKFGYDPRKDPKAKIYQIMDFRVSSSIEIDNEFKQSRCFHYYSLPMKKVVKTQKKSMIKKDHLMALSQGLKEEQDVDEKSEADELPPPNYILIPGRLPLLRQCYFQVCDIHMDKVQQLIHQNDGRERFCHEKDGWCDIGVLDKCREIIAKELKMTARQLVAKNSSANTSE